jgi:hypothetical protein
MHCRRTLPRNCLVVAAHGLEQCTCTDFPVHTGRHSTTTTRVSVPSVQIQICKRAIQSVKVQRERIKRRALAHICRPAPAPLHQLLCPVRPAILDWYRWPQVVFHHFLHDLYVYVCVCVWEREKERRKRGEGGYVCVPDTQPQFICVCVHTHLPGVHSGFARWQLRLWRRGAHRLVSTCT